MTQVIQKGTAKRCLFCCSRCRAPTSSALPLPLRLLRQQPPVQPLLRHSQSARSRRVPPRNRPGAVHSSCAPVPSMRRSSPDTSRHRPVAPAAPRDRTTPAGYDPAGSPHTTQMWIGSLWVAVSLRQGQQQSMHSTSKPPCSGRLGRLGLPASSIAPSRPVVARRAHHGSSTHGPESSVRQGCAFA